MAAQLICTAAAPSGSVCNSPVLQERCRAPRRCAPTDPVIRPRTPRDEHVILVKHPKLKGLATLHFTQEGKAGT